jgi:hypothetical protein
MPTVLRLDGYRLHFYSHEPNEPPHVHVDKGGCSLKVWLEPVAMAKNIGFRPHEISAIVNMVRQRRGNLLEAWHGYFGTNR